MPATIAVDARKLADFGIGTYIRNLIDEFARRDTDHRYVLLVAPDHDLAPGSLDDRFRLRVERAPVYSLRGLFSVSRALRREGADLFHATHYVVPLRLPCPCVVTIHDIIHLLFPEHLPHSAALLYAKFMLGHAVRSAERVITVSDRSAHDLRSRYRLDRNRLQVIANGVEPSFLAAPDAALRASDAEVLARHGLDPGYVLFVGNAKPHKNLERTLQAFESARRQGFEPPLVLVGSSASAIPDRSGSIRPHVRPLGFVASSDLPALYRQASQLVFPSLYEGFGLPALEAMAAGTPVLTSRDSAMAEIVGDYAVLVDPESVAQIRDGMLELDQETEAQRARRAGRGRERASTYTWRRAAERTLALYDEVLDGRGLR